MRPIVVRAAIVNTPAEAEVTWNPLRNATRASDATVLSHSRLTTHEYCKVKVKVETKIQVETSRDTKIASLRELY